MAIATLLGMKAQKKIQTLLAVCLFTGGLLAGVTAQAQSQAVLLEPSLTLYAGPQSAAPLENIHVTIEALDARGRNIHGEALTLVYTASGQEHVINANAVHGLATFEIPAQRRAGHMTFYARYKGYVTDKGLVMIAAGRPKALKVIVNSGDVEGTVNVTSPVLTDDFGNAVTDLSLVSLGWIDSKGLKASHKAQLSNGIISQTLKCPARYAGGLRLQAGLGNLQFLTGDISKLCPSSEALEA